MLHGGDIEPVTRHSRANAQRVQLIIHALSDRFTGDPFLARSDHFAGGNKIVPSLIPGAIGSVAINLERTELGQQQFDIYRCAPQTIVEI